MEWEEPWCSGTFPHCHLFYSPFRYKALLQQEEAHMYKEHLENLRRKHPKFRLGNWGYQQHRIIIIITCWLKLGDFPKLYDDVHSSKLLFSLWTNISEVESLLLLQDLHQYQILLQCFFFILFIFFCFMNKVDFIEKKADTTLEDMQP